MEHDRHISAFFETMQRQLDEEERRADPASRLREFLLTAGPHPLAKPRRRETGLISVEEAAKQLGIGRTLGWRLAREGKLPGATKLGRRVLVSQATLNRYKADPQGWEQEHGWAEH